MTKEIEKQTGLKKFDWPLNGKLRKDCDGILIGETNFQDLINMRYAADCPRGIQGMTPINVAALSGPVLNGHHFRKDLPVESHVFAQVGTTLYKSNNTAVIPNQDTFASFQTLENSTVGIFSDAPDGAMCFLNGSSNRIWEGGEGRCSSFIVVDESAGSFFYDFTDQINNTLTDAQNVARMVAVASVVDIYIGSKRPLQGVKFYVGTANASAATVTAKQFIGSGWSSLTLADGTVAVAGKSLSQTGEITFASTVTTSKLTNTGNVVAFFYHFTFTGLDAGTTVYHCTVDAPMQPINDIWNGVQRTCVQCWKNLTTGLVDYTTNVAISTPNNAKAYDPNSNITYAQFGGMTSSDSIELGFAEPIMGISVSLPDTANYKNTVTASLAVNYWNGTAWASVGNLVDNTSVGGKTFNRSGLITWNPISSNTEFRTSVGNQNAWFYYQLVFSTTISADVRIDAIGGITSPISIRPYKFSVIWQNRLFLCNDITDQQNSALCSNYGTNCVFNGDDSPILLFGDDQGLVAAESLFSRYGQGIYDNLVVLKKNATFLIDGTFSSNWITYTISNEVGCVAPLTLKRCDVSYEVTTGITKHVLLWRSARGMEYFDGNALTQITQDIEHFFSAASSDYIDPLTYDVSQETGFFDNVNFEYHWIFTNANGKQEWTYSLRYKKWSQINRGSTAKALNVGFVVKDTRGNFFSYGGTYDGFIERLENGTTFDGNSMAYKFKLGDILLAKAAEYVTEMRHVKLSAKAKNIGSAKVTCTHYADTASAGTSFPAFTQANSVRRIYQWKQSPKINAVYHCLEFSITTTGELIGFEPLLVSGLYRAIREDVL